MTIRILILFCLMSKISFGLSSIDFTYTGPSLFDINFETQFNEGKIKFVKLSHRFLNDISETEKSFLYYSDTTKGDIYGLGTIRGRDKNHYVFLDVSYSNSKAHYTVYLSTPNDKNKFYSVWPLLALNKSSDFVEMEFVSVITNNWAYTYDIWNNQINHVPGFDYAFMDLDSLNHFNELLDDVNYKSCFNYDLTNVVKDNERKLRIQTPVMIKGYIPIRMLLNDTTFFSSIKRYVGNNCNLSEMRLLKVLKTGEIFIYLEYGELENKKAIIVSKRNKKVKYRRLRISNKSK